MFNTSSHFLMSCVWAHLQVRFSDHTVQRVPRISYFLMHHWWAHLQIKFLDDIFPHSFFDVLCLAASKSDFQITQLVEHVPPVSHFIMHHWWAHVQVKFSGRKFHMLNTPLHFLCPISGPTLTFILRSHSSTRSSHLFVLMHYWRAHLQVMFLD